MVLLGLCLPVDAKKWDGVNIKIVMSDWAKLAIEKFALRFYDKTGLNVTLVADNSVSLVPMMKSESERGFGHDGYMILANTMKEAAHYGYLVDMTDRVRADDNLAWDDYLKFFRDYNSAYNKRTWGMPADGGLLGVFSRADLFPRGQEPQTIDELVEMVEFYDGKDINGDGIPDRGWCECIGPTDDILTVLVNGENTMQFIVTYMQSKGSEQGYFFDPVTMEPNVQAEGFRRGFSQAVRVWRSGTREPENHCNLFPNGETAMTHPRWRWAAGSCVFVVNWLGGVMQDRYFNNTWIGSRKEKVRMFPFPGSTSVDVDGKLTECASDPSVCPYATKGRNGEKINVTPYAALNGGYTMVIGNHSQHIDATFDFMAFVNGPEQSKELVISETTDAFEPFRQTHMVHSEWEKLFGTWITDEFLETTKITNVGDKNIAPDIQLPDGAFYAVDVGIALGEAVSNGKTVDEALVMLRDMWWSRIEKHGFEQMRDLYRATIGLPPYSQVVTTVSQGSSLETWHYIVIAVGCVLVVVAIVVLLYKYQMSQRAYKLQFDNNTVAIRCAKAIASMQLEQVEYLRELSNPNQIQKAFIQIINRLEEYKAYMPQSLFKTNEEPESSCGGDTTKESSSRSRASSATSRSSAASSKCSNQSMMMQRKQVNMSTDLAKRSVSVLVTNVSGFIGSMMSTRSNARSVHVVYLAKVLEASNSHRGVVDEVNGDKVHVSFNTTVLSGGHRINCVTCLHKVTSLLRFGESDDTLSVNGAALSGSVLCGNIGCKGLMRYGIIGTCCAHVWVIERWCKAWGLRNLVDRKMCQDTADMDIRAITRVAVSEKSKLDLYEVVNVNEAKAEEWMYALEEGEKRGLYTRYNDAVSFLYSTSVGDAYASLDKSDTAHDAELRTRIDLCAQQGRLAVPIPISYMPDMTGVAAPTG